MISYTQMYFYFLILSWWCLKTWLDYFVVQIREYPNSHSTKQQLTQVVADESQSHFPVYQQTHLKVCVPIVQLVGLKITHFSYVLYVIHLHALRRETVFCFVNNTQTNEQTTNWRPYYLVVKFILFHTF